MQPHILGQQHPPRAIPAHPPWPAGRWFVPFQWSRLRTPAPWWLLLGAVLLGLLSLLPLLSLRTAAPTPPPRPAANRAPQAASLAPAPSPIPLLATPIPALGPALAPAPSAPQAPAPPPQAPLAAAVATSPPSLVPTEAAALPASQPTQAPAILPAPAAAAQAPPAPVPPAPPAAQTGGSAPVVVDNTPDFAGVNVGKTAVPAPLVESVPGRPGDLPDFGPLVPTIDLLPTPGIVQSTPGCSRPNAPDFGPGSCIDGVIIP